MVKNITVDRLLSRKIFKFIARVFLILMGAVILYIIGVFATAPLFDKIDHDRFITLNTQMQGIFQKLKTASSGVDEWKYEKVCSAEMAGDWPTGQYFCGVTISTDKRATSVEEVNYLQAKYYPVIDNSDALKKITELEPELPNDFGKKFVVSGAYKKYNEIKSSVECDYSIDLYQNTRDINNSYEKNISYGSEINNSLGNMRISLNCTEKARSHWYSVDKITATFTP